MGNGSESVPAWVLTDRLGEPRHRLRHWLREEETWALLVQAGLCNGRRLWALTIRTMPGRPDYGPDDPRHVLRHGYSRREIKAICAAAIAGEAGRPSPSAPRPRPCPSDADRAPLSRWQALGLTVPGQRVEPNGIAKRYRRLFGAEPPRDRERPGGLAYSRRELLLLGVIAPAQGEVI